MHVTLSLTSNDLDAERLQELTRDLCRTLNQETDVQATLVEHPSEAGAKGGFLAEVGNIALLVTEHAGGVVLGHLFIDILKSYWERATSMKVELQREDGQKLVLQSEHVEPAHVQRTMEEAGRFFGGPHE
jgi:hypothetical protein